MGLNIGVRVKKQEEGYMSTGYNPKGTREEIEADFDAHLREKFPESAYNPSVALTRDGWYDFDVRLDYRFNNFDSTPMYMAILEYIMHNFGADYGIDMHVYHSP